MVRIECLKSARPAAIYLYTLNSLRLGFSTKEQLKTPQTRNTVP